MKRLYFNIFAIILLAVSCQDTMEKAEKYPIAGKWVALDDDGFVSHYIEFKTGKYYIYEIYNLSIFCILGNKMCKMCNLFTKIKKILLGIL